MLVLKAPILRQEFFQFVKSLNTCILIFILQEHNSCYAHFLINNDYNNETLGEENFPENTSHLICSNVLEYVLEAVTPKKEHHHSFPKNKLYSP